MSFWSAFLFVRAILGGGTVIVGPACYAVIAATEDHFGRAWVNVGLFFFAAIWLAAAIAVLAATGSVDALRTLVRALCYDPTCAAESVEVTA